MSQANDVCTLSLLSKMREQIKDLQEKRAATMMNEITDLQRERDLAMSKVKQMEHTLTELRNENLILNECCRKEADLKLEIKSLKQLLLENKLYINDLKRKLQTLEKKQLESPNQRMNLLQDKEIKMSHSTGDLRAKIDTVSSGYCSPTLISRRYKLATIETCSQETQTENEMPTNLIKDNVPQHILETLAAARNDILKLQKHNEKLTKKLNESKIENQTNQYKNMQLNKKLQILQQECNVLHENHSQFSQWVQHKLASVEEEMDICKVIYSLHGSLSEETKTIEQLREKIMNSESTISHLTQLNEHLTQSLAEKEKALSNSQYEAKELWKQLQQAMTISSDRYNIYRPSPLLKMNLQ